MGVFLGDTARNTLIKWTTNAVKARYATGAYLSPFTSPRSANGFKRSALETSEQIRAAGGEFWFDPMTYALNMPRAGDFRYYDTWELWDCTRGKLSSRQAKRDHIDRVYAIQSELSSPLLASSLLVSYPDSPMSQDALELSEEAVTAAPSAWLTVAGDLQFWGAGAELDAHIGALDQLEPAGWLLVVARSDNSMPPRASAEEVFGLMRTTFALSQDKPVRVAFGDLAALPAVAAGAEAIGTGWDLRQRICVYQDFEERGSDQDGGGWYQRPTLLGLMGGLTKGEYSTLASESPTLATSLSPGDIGPKPEQAFHHHAMLLTKIVNELNDLAGRDRVDALRRRYTEARPDWTEVRRITGAKIGADRWIKPFLDGLDLFAASEGWV
ncbi:hypothetical protein AB0N89_20160 [Amycolatopsis sp. NPDC089917]|uniref:hypothetical protein n=1 Tax=Amycolatopsis sp. NPDC089917 TaxID=3155187 RepID=UPI00343089F1